MLLGYTSKLANQYMARSDAVDLILWDNCADNEILYLDSSHRIKFYHPQNQNNEEDSGIVSNCIQMGHDTNFLEEEIYVKFSRPEIEALLRWKRDKGSSPTWQLGIRTALIANREER